MLILISDANILIDMHDGNLIEAMFKLSYRFATPDIIYVEELEDRHAYLTTLGLEVHTMDGSLVEKVESYAIQYPKPSRNDLFALVLAQHQKCLLLTGDRDLRKAATNESVEVHGTVWLVKEMHEAGLITVSEAESAFDTMRARGSHLPWKDIEKMITEWKKEEYQVPLENNF